MWEIPHVMQQCKLNVVLCHYLLSSMFTHSTLPHNTQLYSKLLACWFIHITPDSPTLYQNNHINKHTSYISAHTQNTTNNKECYTQILPVILELFLWHTCDRKTSTMLWNLQQLPPYLHRTIIICKKHTGCHGSTQ